MAETTTTLTEQGASAAPEVSVVGLDGQPTNFPADSIVSATCSLIDKELHLLVVYGNSTMTKFAQDSFKDDDIDAPADITPYWSFLIPVSELNSSESTELTEFAFFSLDDQVGERAGFDELVVTGGSEASLTGTVCQASEDDEPSILELNLMLRSENIDRDGEGQARIRVEI